MDITSLIIQLVAGVVGGNAAGAGAKSYSLGPAGNSIAGGVGGLVLGQIMQAVVGGMGMAGTTAGSMDIGAIVGNLAGGGIGGAVLTLVVGLIKNSMAKRA